MGVGSHHQVFFNREGGEQSAAFRHHGQSRLDDIPCGQTTHCLTFPMNGLAWHFDQARQAFEKCGFARAIGTDDGYQLSSEQFKVNAKQCLCITVKSFKGLGAQDGIHGQTSIPM